MRRLEYEDPQSHKFWEITVEGDAYTVRYGKVGAAGQTQTKTFASPDKAAAEGQKQLQSKLNKGYVEVALDADAEAKRAEAEAKRNPALEQALFDDPSNTDAWQVYGDWLQQHNDPRGELISLALQLERANQALAPTFTARIAELEAEHREQLLGGLAKYLDRDDFGDVVELEWSRGYIVKAQVNNSTDEWEGPKLDSILRALVSSPAAMFLRELWVGVAWNEEDYMGMMQDNLRAITKAGKLEALSTLTVADAEGYWDISSTFVGDVTAALRVAPRLRTLRVVGGDIQLSVLDHERLESVTFETGGLPRDAALAIGRCKLPEATSLVVYFGATDYGGDASIADISPLFTGEGLPKLRHLGLVDAEFQDDIARALARGPILAQLRTVDLSLGTMTDAGAHAIVAAAERFAHLERLDLSDNYISEPAQRQLRAALPKLELALGGQREASAWNGRLHYYVSVGE